MAWLIKKASGNLNDSNGYYTSDVSTGGFNGVPGTWNSKLDSAKQIAFTCATNHNTTGVVLHIKSDKLDGLCDRSILFELQENVASVWTTRKSTTLSANTIRGGWNPSNDFSHYTIWVQWDSAYAVTTGSNKWRWQLTQTGGTVGDWYTTTSMYIETTDTSANFAAADSVFLPFDTVLTANAAVTLILIGTGAKFTLGNYTITCGSNGGIGVSTHSELIGGTKNSPLTNFILDGSGATFGSGILAWGTTSNTISGEDARHRIILYGAYPTPSKVSISDTIINGDSYFKTTVDPTASFTNGKNFWFSGRPQGSPDSTIYTVNGAPTGPVNGKWTVNFTPNLTGGNVTAIYNNPAFAVLYPNNYGIFFKGHSSTIQYGSRINTNNPAELVLSGIGVENPFGGIIYTTVPGADPTKVGSFVIEHCASYCSKTVTGSNVSAFIQTLPGGHEGFGTNTRISDVNSMFMPFVGSISYTSTQGSKRASIDNILFCGSGTQTRNILNAANTDISNLYLSNNTGFINNGSLTTLTNVFARGCVDVAASGASSGSYGALSLQGINSIINTVYIDDCATALSVTTSITGGLLRNIYLGTNVANTGDLRFDGGVYSDVNIFNETGEIKISGDQKSALLARMHVLGYNGNSQDYRSWTGGGDFNGQWISSGSTKLTQKYIGAGLKNSWTYRISTEDISGVVAYVSLNCKIANAAFYAGSHIKPSLTATYDVSSTVVANATGTTNEQTLTVTFSPAQNRTEWNLTISGNTDAGSNGNVDWYALVINLRKYGKKFQNYLYTMVRITSDIILNLATPVPNPFISESNESTVSGYSGISIDHANQIVTLSASHTQSELYDYSQYNSALAANIGYPEWLTTLDGSNFTSAYSVVVNTGVTLSGTITRFTLVAGKTLTLNGAGNITFPVASDAGIRVPLVIAGLVAGSRVGIFKASDMSVISEGTAGSSTYTDYVYKTTDISVIIRVRKASAVPKYLPYEVQGTITDFGLAIVVTQILDTIVV